MLSIKLLIQLPYNLTGEITEEGGIKVVGKSRGNGFSEEVPGARQTFTITALIEGIYFGLAFLLIPSTLANLASSLEATSTELFLFRTIGVMALALAIGCWLSRDGTIEQVKNMSIIMTVAKVGTTVVLIAMMINVTTFQAIGWINPILTGVLAVLNFRQYLAVKK